MCAIAGVVATELDSERARSALHVMRTAQRHRGPDDAGEHWDEDARIGLANCRLSIRDLSAAGHMPMCADDVCITYNGEIYNADELRAALQRAGHQFASHSDTEVILRGYLTWGLDVVARLRGMFAFGIFDARTDVLLLARDPLGIKPLYYARTAPFCFASELRALIDSGLVASAVDDRALSAFLQLGSIPAPLTIYRDAAALRPGHTAWVHVRKREQPVLQQYWRLPDGGEAIDEQRVRVALEDAVTSHLVSDVPVGAFLSGGLDSSTVAALAARQSDKPLRTCSIAFESRAHDESPYARAVAAALRTEHYERVVTRADFLGSIDAFTSALDQPSIDGFNTYFVARTAHEAGLKVALSGLGGDELFGGYPSFRGVPRVLRALKSTRAVAGAITSLARSDRWKKVADAARRPVTPASAFLVFRGLFAHTEAKRILPDIETFDAERYVQDRAGAVHGSLQDWVSRAELTTYTTTQLLRDSDAMSMAHSLELRVPLLDTRLVERVYALAPEQRFRGAGNKPLLRRLMSGRLPSIVTEKRPRQGFTFPMQEWLAHAEAQPLWQWDAPVFANLNREALREVEQGFRAGRTHWSRAWAFMALNEWSKRNAHA